MNNQEEKIIGSENPQTAMEAKAQKKPVYKNRFFWGAASLVLVCAVVLTALHFVPGVNLFGTTAATKTDKAPLVSGNAKDVFNAINADSGKPEKVDVNFNARSADSDIDSYFANHIQGYAKYYGVGGDFHIFSYSNVVGKQGYVWFVSKDNSKRFYMKFNPTAMFDQDVLQSNYNHPTGLQVVGDYWAVSVIPAGFGPYFNKASITYIVDLSELKNKTSDGGKGQEISLPYSTVKDLTHSMYVQELENKPSKIVDTAGGDAGSLSAVGITSLDKGYMIALIAGSTVVVYTTENDNLLDSCNAGNYTLKTTYSVKYNNNVGNFQGIGLFRDTATKDVYMVGFDRRNRTEDWADLFRLTENGKLVTGSEINGFKNVIAPFENTVKHCYLRGGAGFEYGSGIEIWSGKLYLTGTESYAKDGNATINIMR
ncbi:MAG: hypothetical protein LBJ11_07620 [Oscillospiraceae bacterium]|jgi:hypothetical protein|nr:hypothetical protein [Oscillospiraceae bacterium]